MTESSAGDCYRTLVQIQKDLRLRNGPTKASVADNLESIISFLKNLTNEPSNPNSKIFQSPSTRTPNETDLKTPGASESTKVPTPSSSLSPQSPQPLYPQLPEIPQTPQERSPIAQKPNRIYPRLSDVTEFRSQEVDKQQKTDSSTQHKLFSSGSYRHEIARKERLVNEIKRSLNVLSNRQTVAVVDSHPHWKTLHEHSPNTGIVQVGGLCFPSAAAGFNELVESQLTFPKVTRILIALGSNDIAHARSAHHDLHSYADTWLTYLSRTLSKLFPNASLKFLLPFTSRAVPQPSIDILQQQVVKAFRGKGILQSPFYAASDFSDAMHLNPTARNQLTIFIAKILTNGKLRSTSIQRNSLQMQNATPLMSMRLNVPSYPTHPSYLPSQVAPSGNYDIPTRPNIPTPANLPRIHYSPPPSISTPHRTYAQVAANTNNDTNSPQEILSQLTSLLPKLIHVISRYH